MSSPSYPHNHNPFEVCNEPQTARHELQAALIVAVLALAAIGVVLVLALAQRSETSSSLAQGESRDFHSNAGSCNVAGIKLRGDLYTYLPSQLESAEPLDASSSEKIVWAIREADRHDDVKAILVKIDSYGGSPVAAEEVAVALKGAGKPTLALIREAGDSAAYWAATGADIIFASANSDVGSIGVTSSFVDNVRRNESEGLRYNEITTGKFKDLGSPDRTMTVEERQLVVRDINLIFDQFVHTVASNRRLSVEKVRAMADGSSMVGTLALEKGLIDKIGLLGDAEAHLSDIIGEPAVVCW